MQTSLSPCDSSIIAPVPEHPTLVSSKMSDVRSAIAKRLSSQPLTAHLEGATLAPVPVDARQIEQTGHPKSAISSPFPGEVASSPLPRQSTQPNAMCSSLPTVMAEDTTPPAQLPVLVGGPSPVSIDASKPAALGGGGPDVCENGSGAAATSAGGRAGSLLGMSKAVRRRYKAADAPNAHRCTETAGSSSACRSTSDRCRAARILAAELMSALMERSPEAAKIAQHRASMESITPLASTAPPAVAEGNSTGSASVRPKAAVHQDTNAKALLAGKGGCTTLSHSFLEVVRSGRAKQTRALLTGTQRAHPQTTPDCVASLSPLASHAASPDNGAPPLQGSASPGDTTIPIVAETAPAQSSVSKLPELVPGDTATIPQLLSVLREIALSCGSLDTLGKTANGLASFSGGAAAAHPHTKPMGGAISAVTGATARVADSGGAAATSDSRSTAGRVAVNTAHPQCDLDVTEEEHWHRVLAHFEVVRRLVLNEHELARALDETFGADWRAAPKPPSVQADEEDAVAVARVSPAVSAEGLRNPLTVALSGLPVARTASAPVSDKPTPADAEMLPTLSFYAVRVVGGAGAPRPSADATSAQPTVSSQSGTSATEMAGVTPAASAETMLNHSARPFHGRTPPSVQQQQQSVLFSPAAHSRGASTNHAASSSMKQLSESSSNYSPSQQVAMMLVRGTTPPPPSRTQDEGEAGLLNFPSTPLSEAAVPYQPSASLMSTSPRGGNPSSSGSAPFHLETREEMLRRRSAAPNAFYASMSHRGVTHCLGGPLSAATTPGTFASSSVASGVPPFSLNGGAGGARSMPVSPLVSYSSPLGALPCPYEYLLVLDFEATCEEHPPPNYLYEIIEFPVVVVDVRLQRVVAEFHRFVRPRYKRELSPFCKKLTGMRQEDVDTAAPLEEVVLQFERWFSHTLPPHARCVFATDGPTDLREFMYYHSVCRQGIRFPPLFYQFIDVKQTFARFFGCSQGKIKAMLEVLHMPFEGRLHSGLDDARNIASIVVGLLHYGCSFCEAPLNRLPFSGLPLSGASGVSGSAPLVLPPSTAPAASCRAQSSGAPATSTSDPSTVKKGDRTR
ncbi:hypothetical protein GH5_03621 [Leishmania sp. Ghana 2012 LV757]|uniref:hypothetical protein n=1 Tax=Leishmania sp. Ghana 2012 LV757 TaxID=2803181 RepID=UPI001B5430B8|nr:hypothetical protein GH5_03621 [Leishmania sp. Ghana 2012 LV757]